MKQEDSLKSMKKKGKTNSKRLKGGGRKPLDEDLEEAFFDWIVDLRQQSLRVSRTMIICQAKTLSSNGSFEASIGWLNGFLKRKCLSLRRKTTLCQNPPAACAAKLVDFIMRLRSLQRNSNFAMDELPAGSICPLTRPLISLEQGLYLLKQQAMKKITSQLC